MILSNISFFSKLPTNSSNYFLSNVKKYESSLHIIVPVLFEPVTKDTSPKANPGVNVKSFCKNLFMGK